MADQPWFKVWAQPVLGSIDLNNFTDHQERVWWRLLCVASEQPERWHITTSLQALARMCASTPPKTKAALSRFEQLGMVRKDEAGGWWIANWEKYQETPEARRQRLKRERDRERDMSRDKSRPLSRQEDKRTRGLDLLPTEDKSSSEEGADAPLPRPKKTALTVGFKAEMAATYGAQLRDFEETWAFHQDSAYLKKKDDKQAYMEGRLKAAVAREATYARSNSNGRNLAHSAGGATKAGGFEAYR